MSNFYLCLFKAQKQLRKYCIFAICSSNALSARFVQKSKYSFTLLFAGETPVIEVDGTRRRIHQILRGKKGDPGPPGPPGNPGHTLQEARKIQVSLLSLEQNINSTYIQRFPLSFLNMSFLPGNILWALFQIKTVIKQDPWPVTVWFQILPIFKKKGLTKIII